MNELFALVSQLIDAIFNSYLYLLLSHHYFLYFVILSHFSKCLREEIREDLIFIEAAVYGIHTSRKNITRCITKMSV